MISGEKISSRLLPSYVSQIYDSFLTLVYPQACEICGKSVENRRDGYVCFECWQETKIFTGNETLCSKCSAFLKDSPCEYETFCRRCDDDFYDSAKSIGLYEKAFLTSIMHLKRKPFLPETIGSLFYEAFLQSGFIDADLIIPVPLSENRFAERGFNQAEILGKNLADKSGLELNRISLTRKSHIEKSRAGMDRKARHESVKKAFEVVSPKLIEGRVILLIDDVFTSGATVSNCAKALKKAGAEKVYVLTLARAV